MRDELRSIGDACRAALNEYTVRAFSLLPPIDVMRILDAGCGSGEPALALTRMSAAHICAIDPDAESCAAMGRKVARDGFANRVTVMNVDFASPEIQKNPFDVVWAEGLFNIIGFEAGLARAGELLKPGGYLVIHDEISRGEEKKRLWEKHGYWIVDSFVLPENAWPDYFECMKTSLSALGESGRARGDDSLVRAAEDVLAAIEERMKRPENLRSVFYILRKRNAHD